MNISQDIGTNRFGSKQNTTAFWGLIAEGNEHMIRLF